ncbi:LOW protein: M-phase inducer phosphatase-like protein [Quillaja saponaria]|uniref:LOW protein: M-phase inducer phosphatase-like protein n=1 Tax=Quillaja saponaria TaxID=32244 RepID=A0AAD7M4X9_QUISA|nr:LOW protein: M-phase inducer phosphatase-like protein [Quillaja saponaria]
MGREWYWTGRPSKRGGVGADRETHSGCMCAVFQFFDLQKFHFPLNQQQPSFKPATFVPQDHILPKGIEAPRNSLESEEGRLSLIIKKEESLQFPIGIQIKTRGSKGGKTGNPDDSSSEISSSPGTKTPTLVARLMGLDLLPESQSPSTLSSLSNPPNLQVKPHLHPLRTRQHLQTKPRSSSDSDITGSRSLPETPRISSSRRSDVDHHHRLSLQISKENMGHGDESEGSRSSYSRRKVENHTNRSPSHYARQIVKQVKESVSRRSAGLDITNTVKNREHGRRDELLLTHQFKYKKPSKPLVKVVDESSPAKNSTTSCSPRFRFTETKNKTSTTPTQQVTPKDQNFHPPKPSSSSTVNVQQPIRVLTKTKPQPSKEQQLQNQKSVPKCKKAVSERFSSRLKKPPQTSDIIRNKQEEQFVRTLSTTRASNPDINNKSKKSHALSNNLTNLNTVPNLLPVKKCPSQKQSQASNTQEPKFRSQLSSCSIQRYQQEAREATNDKDKSKGGASTSGPSEAEFQYLSNIVNRTGIDRDTKASFTNWVSPSHPLDPSIFHQLEHSVTTISTATDTKNVAPNILDSYSQLGYRCNRKLLFDVVDEILVEILKPYMNMKPWVSGRRHNHSEIQASQLIDILCRKIRSFPMADCRVLEDIDGLIEQDLPKLKHQRALEFEEEGQRLVTEMERDIWDTLVNETVMALGDGGIRVHALGRRRFGWEELNNVG